MRAEWKEKVDFSSFLTLVNAGVTAAILCLFCIYGPNEYVGWYTVLLAMAFSAQNFFFLAAVKRKPDPFLFLIVLHAVFFYELRIATLIWKPFSIVFVRNAFSGRDLDAAILYVIAANFCAFVALAMRPDEPARRAGTDSPVALRLWLPVFLFCLGVLLNFDWAPLRAYSGYFGILFNYEIMLLFFFVFVALYYRQMTRRQKTMLLLLVIVFLTFRTAMGSRSALLTVFVYFFCAWVSVKGYACFPKWTYAAFAIMAPAAVMLFIVATLVRAPIVPITLQTMLDRMGLLDMAAEVMANRFQYGQILNFQYYFKSVADSGLTPGFSLFDAPKAANVLSLLYHGMSTISLQTVRLNYQSDMLTLYGEAYALFGAVAGLAAISLVTYFFGRLYAALASEDPFRKAALRSAVLVVFYTYVLGSFGLDWFLVDAVRSLVPFIVLLYLFQYNARRIGGNNT